MLGLQQYTKRDRRRNDRITMLLHLLRPGFLFQLATGKGMRHNLTTVAGPLPSIWLRRVLLSIVVMQQRSHKWKVALSVLDRGPGPQCGGRWGRENSRVWTERRITEILLQYDAGPTWLQCAVSSMTGRGLRQADCAYVCGSSGPQVGSTAVAVACRIASQSQAPLLYLRYIGSESVAIPQSPLSREGSSNVAGRVQPLAPLGTKYRPHPTSSSDRPVDRAPQYALDSSLELWRSRAA
jgi:hypothetical protein